MSADARNGRVAFVLLVWLGFTLRAGLWLAQVASPIPMRDDLIFVVPLVPDHPGFVSELWAPINEHRVPLARALMAALLALHQDIRVGMFAQIAVLSLCALGAILLARRLRGRTSPFDALFPLLFLHLGYTESWLLALQLTVALPTALVLAAVAFAVWRPGPPRAATLAGVAACALALVTCGGFGWSQMPPWAAWLGWCAWRARGRGDVRTAWIGALGLALVSVVSVLYALGLPYRAQEHGAEFGRAVAIAVQFVSSFAGPFVAREHVLYLVLATVLAVATLAGLAHVARTRPDERERAGALLAGSLGVIAIACAVGVSRQDDWPVAGWAARYMGAQAPLVVCAVLATLLYAPRAFALWTQSGLALALTAALPFNEEAGRFAGEERVQLTREMYAAVGRGAQLGELSQLFWKRCFINAIGYKDMLGIQLGLHLPPFDRELAVDPTRFENDPLALFDPRPVRWTAPRAPLYRNLNGNAVVALPADAALVFEPRAGARHVSAKFGVLPWTWAQSTLPEQRTRGVEFRVSHTPPGGATRVLWQRRLDPVQVAADRGLQALELDLPAALAAEAAAGELVFEVRGVGEAPASSDWGAWSALVFR